MDEWKEREIAEYRRLADEYQDAAENAARNGDMAEYRRLSEKAAFFRNEWYKMKYLNY